MIYGHVETNNVSALFDRKVQALENSSTRSFNWPEVFPLAMCYLNNAWPFLMKRALLATCPQDIG